MKLFFFYFTQSNEEDTSMFDRKFTRMTPVDSPVDRISESVNKLFEGFTYIAPSILDDLNRTIEENKRLARGIISPPKPLTDAVIEASQQPDHNGSGGGLSRSHHHRHHLHHNQHSHHTPLHIATIASAAAALEAEFDHINRNDAVELNDDDDDNDTVPSDGGSTGGPGRPRKLSIFDEPNAAGAMQF